MTPTQFVASLPKERQAIIKSLRSSIIKSDPDVREAVGMMMGKQMLIFFEGDTMKYALSSMKDYMSFHSMVMYGMAKKFGGSSIREQYEGLLPNVKFQQGCMNFRSAADLPLEIIEPFIVAMGKIKLPVREQKKTARVVPSASVRQNKASSVGRTKQ